MFAITAAVLLIGGLVVIVFASGNTSKSWAKSKEIEEENLKEIEMIDK